MKIRPLGERVLIKQTKQEETTKVIIDDEVPVEAKLDLDQKKTIEDNVSALGDAEKVRELYKGDIKRRNK